MGQWVAEYFPPGASIRRCVVARPVAAGCVVDQRSHANSRSRHTGRRSRGCCACGSEDGRVLRESPADLPVQMGKPLDRAQVAESLRILYRTGNYADLRADATPIAGGL